VELIKTNNKGVKQAYVLHWSIFKLNIPGRMELPWPDGTTYKKRDHAQ
jgi:hypothetical protein